MVYEKYRVKLEPLDALRGRLSLYFGRRRNPDVTLDHGLEVLEGIKSGEIYSRENGFIRKRKEIIAKYSHFTGEGRELNKLAYVLLLENSFYFPSGSGKVMDQSELESKVYSLVDSLGRLRRNPTREEETDMFRSLNRYKRGVHRNAVRILKGDGVDRGTVMEMVDNYKSTRRFANGIASINNGLVYMIGNRVCEKDSLKGLYSLNGFAEMDPVLSDGGLSLMKAIDGFDFNMRYGFSTYAGRAIIRDIVKVSFGKEMIREKNNYHDDPDSTLDHRAAKTTTQFPSKQISFLSSKSNVIRGTKNEATTMKIKILSKSIIKFRILTKKTYLIIMQPHKSHCTLVEQHL